MVWGPCPQRGREAKLLVWVGHETNDTFCENTLFCHCFENHSNICTQRFNTKWKKNQFWSRKVVWQATVVYWAQKVGAQPNGLRCLWGWYFVNILPQRWRICNYAQPSATTWPERLFDNIYESISWERCKVYKRIIALLGYRSEQTTQGGRV